MGELDRPLPDATGTGTGTVTVPASATRSPGAGPADRSAGPRADSGPFPGRPQRIRYAVTVIVLALAACAFGVGYLAIGNPMPVGTVGFWRIAELRVTTVITMLIVATCQALATVSFQTVTDNRIITPSIMGFESLYTVIQTSAVYFLGVAGLTRLEGPAQFVLQLVAMVALSAFLYGWLLSGKYANLQVMLLIGIVLGGGLGAIATFMQRLLTPSEFDVLTARLFGSMSNADVEYFPIAIPLVVISAVLLWMNARRLNVLALGRDTAINLGVNHRRQTVYTLVLVSVLMATSTALIGPMTFFGFLVATLSYQLTGTYDHRRVLPVAILLAFVVLSGAYFIMNNVFYAHGLVSLIIELVGGSVFLIVIMRKGRL